MPSKRGRSLVLYVVQGHGLDKSFVLGVGSRKDRDLNHVRVFSFKKKSG